MASVWDQEVSTENKGILVAPVIGKPHIVELFKEMQVNPNNPDAKAVGDRLKQNMDDGSFRTKLNESLADPNVRHRIAELNEKNPAGLRQHLDELSQHPENLASIVNGIPLKAAVAAPVIASNTSLQPSPEPVAPAHHHHHVKTESGGAEVQSSDQPVAGASSSAPQSGSASGTTATASTQPTSGASPAADGAMTPQMQAFLQKPENVGFARLLDSLNGDQMKVVKTTLKTMSDGNPGMLDELSEMQAKHKPFFDNLFNNLQNGPKDAAGFQTALTSSMNSVKTLGLLDMILPFIGKFLAPILDKVGMHDFAKSLTNGSFEEKIAGNSMASTAIAKTADEATPMVSLVSGLFNNKSGASPDSGGQRPLPQTAVAENNGAAPLPSGNLAGASTNNYATNRSTTPDQSVTVNGATYAPASAPTVNAGVSAANPFAQLAHAS